MDNETRALLRRIEALEREVIALRKRVGNMPVRFATAAGGTAGEPTTERSFSIYDDYLPDPGATWGENGEGLGALVYLRSTRAFYRLVDGPLGAPAEGPTWAATTIPRQGAWGAGAQGRTGLRTGEIYTAIGANGDELHFVYGHAEGYPTTTGCLSSIDLPGASGS